MNKPARNSLAGATILQLTPALRDDPVGRTALGIARAMRQSGARAIVASEGGPMAGELRDCGGEWLRMRTDTFNPLRIRRNAARLRHLISSERIDIVHAQSAGAARSAIAAADRLPVFLATSFPDWLPQFGPVSWFGSSLARGGRIIAPSGSVSRAVIERFRIRPDRITVIPRSVDTTMFSPDAVGADRVAALHRAWEIQSRMRVVLVLGQIAPWNGQMSAIEAAHALIGNNHDITFVFAGEDRRHAHYVRALRRRAQVLGINAFCRLIGPCADMPAAYAAADVVVVPALDARADGHAAAAAQAMGRPVIATDVGALPENLLSPPRMADDLRTGWLVPPGDAGEFARAIGAALALDITSYKALSARARQFAEFAFSPQSVAAAVRAVYTSLLARDA